MPMSLPNIITIARILTAPITVWLIISQEFLMAFLIFVAAGISDGVDGFIAKRFNAETALGAYLDPLADKLLLVSIYISLGARELLPLWLVITVASRDVLIIGGVLLAWLIDLPMKMRPLLVSKINTTAQIMLAGAVLGALGLSIHIAELTQWGSLIVGALTVASGAVYTREWLRHMASGDIEV